MTTDKLIYLGIKGKVVALDKSNGERVWLTPLKSGDFVNLFYDGEALFAHTGGELFCLEPATGELRWRNELTGLGYGLATFASTNVPGANQMPAVAAEIARQERERRNSQSSNTGIPPVMGT